MVHFRSLYVTYNLIFLFSLTGIIYKSTFYLRNFSEWHFYRYLKSISWHTRYKCDLSTKHFQFSIIHTGHDFSEDIRNQLFQGFISLVLFSFLKLCSKMIKKLELSFAQKHTFSWISLPFLKISNKTISYLPVWRTAFKTKKLVY